MEALPFATRVQRKMSSPLMREPLHLSVYMCFFLPDTCLIGGVCYDVGDSYLGLAFVVCQPSVSNTSWFINIRGESEPPAVCRGIMDELNI